MNVVKCIYAFPHGDGDSFLKNRIFRKLPLFFILKTIPDSDKHDPIF